MSSMVRKAKSARGKRILKKRESKIVEGEKSTIFLKTTTVTKTVSDALLDLAALKKPMGKVLQHKNPMHPFDDASSLEFLCRVNDSSLFVVGSDSKKRPHSLTLGRTFDWQILDMMEFQINPNTFKTIKDLSAERNSTARIGAARLMMFVGEAFDGSDEMKTFKSLMLDFFRANELKKVNLAGLDSVIVISASTNPVDASQKRVYFRHYNILKKKSGGRFPRVVLDEVGPRMDMVYNRVTEGSNEVKKQAYKHHYAAKVRRQKNTEIGQLGTVLGRIHMDKQDLNQMALAKLKGLGKRVNHGAKRRAEDDGYDLSDDFEKADMQAKKRFKAVPKAYASAVISE